MIPGIPSPWIILGAVVFLAVACAASYHFGTTTQENADNAKINAEKLASERAIAAANDRRYNAVADLVVNQAKSDELHAQQLAEARANVQVVTRVIQSKVIEYVTPKADAACTIPVGFVLLHDAAARGEATDSALAAAAANAGGVDNPSGIALSTVERTVAENYGACSDWKTELIAWRAYKPALQQWYDKLQGAIQ